jgi:RHS repeat-associated protein
VFRSRIRLSALFLVAALGLAAGAEREDGQKTPATIQDLRGLDRIDVEPFSGALRYERTDLVIGEGDAQLVLRRTWSTAGGNLQHFGLHWASPLSLRVEVQDERAVFIDEAGYPHRFRGNPEVMVAIEGRPTTLRRFKRGSQRGWILEGRRPHEALAFDTKGRVRALRVRGKVVRRYRYDAQGALSSVSGPWGRLRVVRDERGRLNELLGPDGIRIRYGWTPENRLSQVSRDARQETYGYDSVGRLDSLARGQARVRYDDFNRVTELSGAGIHTARLSYGEDLTGGTVTTLTRGASTTRLTRSLDGRTLTRTLMTGGVEVLRFDARHRLQERVRGQQRWAWTHDTLGRLTRYDSPQGPTTFRYAAGQGPRTQEPTAITLPGDLTVRFRYDESGRRTAATHPAFGTFTTTYDDAGRVSERRTSRGLRQLHRYDERGYLSQVEVAGQTTRYERGPDGRLLVIHNPDGSKVESGDTNQGRRVTLRDGSGLIQDTLYDRRGRPLRRTDDLGRTSVYRWTLQGDLSSVRDELGLIARFEYAAGGQLTAVIDGAGSAVRYSRPDAKTVIVSDDTRGQTRIEHDPWGRVLRQVRPEGQTRFAYDSAGRLTTRTTTLGKTSHRETFAYDAAGRTLLQEGPQGGYRMAYDAAGRLEQLTNTALGKSVRYGYDETGARTSMTLPWGTTRYGFDVAGQLETLTTPAGEEIRFARTPGGERSAIHYPNGVVTRFLREGRILKAVETRKGETLLSRRAYSYDRHARVSKIEDEGGRATLLERDGRGRVTKVSVGATSEDFAYDLAGNRSAVDGTKTKLGQGNRLLRQGQRRLRYDESGALVGIEAQAGTTRLAYTPRGQLQSATLPGGETVRYGYAPNGTRLWRQDGAGKTHYLNDLANVVGEFRQGKLSSSFVHGEGVDDVLQGRWGGESFFYHYDQVRSVTALSDAKGTVAARYAYSPFGEAKLAEGRAAQRNPFRYTSRERDGRTGLYHYRARSYSPELGRFTTPDPAGRVGGFNLYAYASNDPASFNDPYGLWPQWLNDAVARGRDVVSEATTSALGWADQYPGTRQLANAARFSYGLSTGFVNGVVGGVKGVAHLAVAGYETVRDGTYDEAWQSIRGIYDNREAIYDAVGDKLVEYGHAALNDPQRFGEMTGYFLGEAALAAVGTKGLDKVGVLGKAASVAGHVTRPVGRVVSGATAPIRRAAAPVLRPVGDAARAVATSKPGRVVGTTVAAPFRAFDYVTETPFMLGNAIKRKFRSDAGALSTAAAGNGVALGSQTGPGLGQGARLGGSPQQGLGSTTGATTPSGGLGQGARLGSADTPGVQLGNADGLSGALKGNGGGRGTTFDPDKTVVIPRDGKTVVPRRTGVAPGRANLEEFADRVWKDRDQLAGRGDRPIYRMYNQTDEANPLGVANDDYLNRIGRIARERPAGTVSNPQGLYGPTDDILANRAAGQLDPSVASRLDNTFYRFERANWKPEAVTERVYVNASADHAPQMMNGIVKKILDDPASYPGVEMAKISGPGAVGGRAENIVIYTTGPEASERVLRTLREVQQKYPQYFQNTTPALTERVAPGISRGAEPTAYAGQESFGSIRAKAVSEALEKTTRAGGDRAAFLRNLDESFRRYGIDPDNPHRNLPGGPQQ